MTSIRVVSGPEPAVRAAGRRRGRRGARSATCRSTTCRSCNRRRQEGAAALRELLELYAPSADASARRQIEGIRSVRVGPRRAPAAARRARSRSAAASRSPCASTSWRSRGRARSCSASVLDRYFARHVSINSFTETVLRSESRGEINRWVPQWGARPTL